MAAATTGVAVPGRAHAWRARADAALPLVPAFVLAAVWIVWVPYDGGYFPRSWYPVGLLAAAFVLVLAVARPRGSFARSPATLPLLLLGGWTLWNAVSLVWSPAAGAGREATNELLTAVLAATVLAATPWRSRPVLLLLGLWAGAIAVYGAVDLISFARDLQPETRLLEGRYLGPVGYANGTAAIGAMAFWPLLAIAARPATPTPWRVAALPLAIVTLLWSALPQSRATLVAAVAVLPLFVLLAPNRVRVLTRLVVVAGALALSLPDLFDVYSAAREGRPIGPIADAAAGDVLLSALFALLAGIALELLERHVHPGARAVRAGRRAAIAAGAVVLVAAALAAALSAGRIADEASERWRTFSSDASVENTQTGARLGQVTADKRYDYYTVAWRMFEERPLAGHGAAAFEPRYTADKRYEKHSRYVHDVWLRALSETGVIGLALLVGALVAGLVALVRARWRASEARSAVAAAAALSAAFWLQCSLDWLEEIPALLVPAVALPLAALRASAGIVTAVPPLRRTVPFAVVAVLAAAAFALPYIAVREIDRGDDLRGTDPADAVAAYDRAAAADPLLATPHLRVGFLGVARGDRALARRGFRAALEVQEGWVARFELGLLASQADRQDEARRQLRRAAQLNGNDPLVTDALAAVEDGTRLDPREVNAGALDQPVLSAPR